MVIDPIRQLMTPVTMVGYQLLSGDAHPTSCQEVDALETKDSRYPKMRPRSFVEFREDGMKKKGTVSQDT